ncbi:MAG TPA: DUF1573 domain-containing protein [Hanamia sp.]|nr:DUF1573 domain-containing protein [Hanamia sp.]
MKKIVTVIFCLVASIGLKAQAKSSEVTKIASPNAPKVEQAAVPEESLLLKENEFDFGKIPQGKPVTHIFEFTNTGKAPFSLEKVQASCGCTTPEWNNDVIAPGATGKITVGYNAANEGPFTKPVTITYNGNLVKQIVIKGDVWKTPVTSAPENSALNSLKNEQ